MRTYRTAPRDALRPAAPVLERDIEGPWVRVTRPTPEILPEQRGQSVTLISGDAVLYEMRTKPHLYDEWLLNLQEDNRAAYAASLDKFDWDCHKCHTSVLTDTLDDRCPNCGLR